MANRSMDAKHKRGVKQRQEAGRQEGYKPAYRTNKPLLREIAANAQHMVKPAPRVIVEPSDVVMVPYMPHRAPRKWTAVQKAYVNCGDELVKWADYLKR
jgi:hypothetical protein